MKKLTILLLGALACFSLNAKNVVIQETADTFAHIPAPLKKAKWIWPNPAAWYDIVNCYAFFRQPFNLDNVPEKATIYITADQAYKLYINGTYICRGPARGHQENMPYDEIDVTKYLKKGKNLIAVRGYTSGKSTFAYVHQSFAGILYALDLGNNKHIVSHGKIKCIRDTSVDRFSAQGSMQINYQEHVDMRKFPVGWEQIDFDDSKWGYSEGYAARTYNAMPWYNFQPRGTPMNEEFVLPFPKIVAMGEGKASSMSEIYRNINELFDKEPMKMKSADGVAESIKIKKLGDEEVVSYILDFGKTVVAMPIIKVEGAKGGEIVDIMASEKLHNDLTLRNDYKDHCKPACSDRLICREGNQEHEFFSLYGFRFMELRVRANKASDLKVSVTAKWSAYPLGDKGKFTTSDSVVNSIWKASVNTQRACAMDGYVDTPHREQAQWWGDARVQAWNTFFISGDARLLRRGIRIISQQNLPNGALYGHAPTMAHTCILPDFNLTWILTIWDYYWQTGKIDAYTEHRETLLNNLKYFDSVTDEKTGLLKYDDRYWLFLDWCGIHKQGFPAVYNLWYLYAHQKMAELCERNGIKEDAEFFKSRAKKIEQAIKTNLLDSDGLVHDGIYPNGKLNPKAGIHCQTLAKLCNLDGFNFKNALDKVLLPFINEKRLMKDIQKGDGPYPSSYWVIYTLDVLEKAGYGKEVFEFYKRNWAHMIPYNGTYEGYSEDSDSYSHAWSAHSIFMFPRMIGGIKQIEPAWTEVEFKPTDNLVDNADILYPTPHGDIKVKVENGKARIVEMPKVIKLKK